MLTNPLSPEENQHLVGRANGRGRTNAGSEWPIKTRSDHEVGSDKHTTTIMLKDSSGSHVGELRLLESPPSGKDTVDPECHHGEAFELVEVSKGYAYIDEMHDIPGMIATQYGEKYEFYDVMWIEREGEVAFRKGLGRVLKEHWEAQDRETIDLVLG